MKTNKKKILIYSILGIITVLIVTLTITYAYWILTRQQTGENVVNTACLNITFTGENDISLDKAYPMNEEQLEKFLSSATPYHFTIHNECSELASASINLESLTVSGKALEDEYIDAILYEDDYNTNLNRIKKLSTPNDASKVIAAAKHAYSLYNFTLKANEERDFNLLLYMDPDTPMVEDNMNATWKGKITLSTEYQEENTIIRKISITDTQGMWGYKDKLTKIVIENKKSEKTGEKVYGPFDESADGYGGVQSYVVCDASDENCTGYLQGTNGIKGNEDSSNLFNGFTNVTNIEGLKYIDTSNVKIMDAMFYGIGLTSIDLSDFDTSSATSMSGMFMTSKLSSIDLSMWDVSHVINMGGMLHSCPNLTEINISNWDLSALPSQAGIFGGGQNLDTINMANVIFPKNSGSLFSNGLSSVKHIIFDNVDTTNVTSMYGMFAGCSGLQSLDLSDFDTTNVTNIEGMFSGCTSLQTLDLSNFVFPENIRGLFAAGLSKLNNVILDNVDTSKVIDMSGMFSGCTSLPSLDLSSFDTTNVTNFNNMFSGTTSLQSITFGSKFVHKSDASTSGMFNGCSAPERPTGDTWTDVSFD